MLRISTIQSGDQDVILRLEGRVIGPWVGELRRACDGILGEGGRLTLDLSEVSFLDVDGVALVHGLTRDQAAVVNCSPFVAEQLRRMRR